MRRILLLAALMMWAGAAGATNYLVDSVTGDNGDSGLTEALAWATMNGKIEALTAGDTVFVRSRHEETLSSDIALTGDGTANSPVVIWGDDAGTGPDRYWQYDSGDSTATLTCNGYQMRFDSDEHWHIHRIHFTTITEFAIFASRSALIRITNCDFTAMASSSNYCVYAPTGGSVEIFGCAFNGGGQGYGIYTSNGAFVSVENSTFDNLTFGVRSNYGPVDLVNCEFGQVVANTYDVYLSEGAGVPVRIFGGALNNNDGLEDPGTTRHASRTGFISRFYNDAGTKQPMLFINGPLWEALANYSVARDGGAPYSIAFTTPIADAPGTFNRNAVMNYAVYADSAETRTYSLYAYRDANWGSAPAANELYIEVQYQFADTIRSEVSTQTLTNAETWYALSVADVSPQHDGPVHITLWLGDYDANGKIHIDPRLVATGELYHETFDWGVPSLAFWYIAPAAGGVPWKQIF